MAKGCRKLRMSYDELAYILSLFDIDTYMFFENQGRSIDVEKAVPLINGIIRKKWLIPGKERYTISTEIRQYVEHIIDNTCLFSVKAKYYHRHDLLCYSLKNSILSMERDYNREEYILLCINDVGSFADMLEEEGYLGNIIPVNEEDLNDAEKSLADFEKNLDSTSRHESEDISAAVLSFECLAERKQKECDSSGWLPEDPFVEEDEDTHVSHGRSNTEVHVYGKALYPYIAVKKDGYTIRIPYNKKNLEEILSRQLMGRL